ncbi:hypothetical protein JCM15765_13490 [Paradesulfitobacterium aromaticivorans]
MEVRCKVCGDLKYVTKVHKDYHSISKNPNYPYICETCSTRIQTEMQKLKGLRKFSHYPSNEDWSEGSENNSF